MQSVGRRHLSEMGVAYLDAFLSILAKDEMAGLLSQTEGVTAMLTGGTASPLDSLHQV
jgi:hypothetical protein